MTTFIFPKKIDAKLMAECSEISSKYCQIFTKYLNMLLNFYDFYVKYPKIQALNIDYVSKYNHYFQIKLNFSTNNCLTYFRRANVSKLCEFIR